MRRTISVLLGSALIAAAVSACGGSSGNDGGKPLKGAGSSLVYPLVSGLDPSARADRGLDLSYNAIGSGGGIQAITTRTVDFGASDAPLTPDQAKACKGCVQIPWALSATTLAYDAKTLGRGLKLTGPVIADIYLGKITNWSDPRIAALNPGKKLPVARHRGDLPVRGVGGHIRAHLVPVEGLARVEGEGRDEHDGHLPGRRRRKGNSGVAGTLSRTPGRHRLHQRRLCRPEQARGGFDRERGGTVRPPRCERDRGRRGRDGQARSGQFDLDRRPARLCRGRLSDLDVLVRDRAQELLESSELKQLLDYALGPGQLFARSLRVRPAPARVVSLGKKTTASLGTD